MLRLLLLVILNMIFLLPPPLWCNEKIIYMIATPRSSSTAFLRMMQARGDFTIMNEPSLFAFFKGYFPHADKNAFTENAKETHSEVIHEVFSKAETTPVFVKDMGFFTPEDFIKDEKLLTSPDVYFVFLVRDPHNSIISFYKIFQRVIDRFSYCIGCEPSYEIYQKVKEKSPHQPLIILAEDLYANPQKTIAQFCEAVGISFKEEALHWDSLSEQFTGFEEWSESKSPQSMKHWHSGVIQSTGFYPAKQNHLSEDGKPSFKEILNEEDREKCRQAYEKNLIYYLKFKEEQSQFKRNS